MPSGNLERFLSEPIYAIEDRLLISAVSNFLQFSEGAITRGYREELDEIEHRNPVEDFEWDLSQHLRDLASFRYEVMLPLNIRYSAVLALVMSVAWSVNPFVKHLKEKLSSKPPGRTSLTVHRLSELRARTGVGTPELIADYAALVRVRDCIAHNAGMAESPKYERDLSQAVARLEGFSFDTRNLIGRHVWIERNALDPLIVSMQDFIVGLKTAAYEQGLVRETDQSNRGRTPAI